MGIFKDDPSYVNMRCIKDTKILMLTYEKLKQLIKKYDQKPFGKELKLTQIKLIKSKQKYPCDYITHYPKFIRALYFTDDEAYRLNAMKNVVMRMVLKIRERKKQPKLSEFMKVYREKRDLIQKDEK